MFSQLIFIASIYLKHNFDDMKDLMPDGVILITQPQLDRIETFF